MAVPCNENDNYENYMTTFGTPIVAESTVRLKQCNYYKHRWH